MLEEECIIPSFKENFRLIRKSILRKLVANSGRERNRVARYVTYCSWRGLLSIALVQVLLEVLQIHMQTPACSHSLRQKCQMLGDRYALFIC